VWHDGDPDDTNALRRRPRNRAPGLSSKSRYHLSAVNPHRLVDARIKPRRLRRGNEAAPLWQYLRVAQQLIGPADALPAECQRPAPMISASADVGNAPTTLCIVPLSKIVTSPTSSCRTRAQPLRNCAAKKSGRALNSIHSCYELLQIAGMSARWAPKAKTR